jgi:HTH-type transcriptional regulator/antitoxin HigA
MQNMTRGGGKMIARHPAIDERKYGRLLAKTLPVPIETEEQYERMLAQAEPLFDKGEKLSPEETVLLKLLSHLIQEYEEKHYRLNASTPHGILRELMEARGVRPSQMWEILGSKGYASDIINGKREISKAQARKLAEFFNVSVELFI